MGRTSRKNRRERRRDRHDSKVELNSKSPGDADPPNLRLVGSKDLEEDAFDSVIDGLVAETRLGTSLHRARTSAVDGEQFSMVELLDQLSDSKSEFTDAANRLARLATGKASEEELAEYEKTAEDLAFEALEALEDDDDEESLGLVLEALTYDPGCADALLILAELTCDGDDDLIDKLDMTVKIAAEKLGREYFDRHRGYFWGLMETRPYMRARLRLVQVLVEFNRLADACAHLEEMLELNPNDNQGLRYNLLGCYLLENRLEDARRLFDQYKDEESAIFTWSRVLERFLADDQAGAQLALSDARLSNLHVEKFLTGRRRLPKESPPFYTPHESSEAVVCMEYIGPAWKRSPKAVAWLKARA